MLIVRKSGVKDEHEARDIAVANLREYNDYVNGNAYVVRVGKRVPFYDYESGCSIQSYYYEYDDDHEPEYVYGYSEAEKLAEKLAEKIKSSTN